ncbi:leucine-rich repeat extensin-like protein 7 [Iris pallida]|uniref:Leucine-rich repeat extensin-like protein 7 n=1 Tax=Iris pallida TaxID=29817 RepID=A0AAX6HEX0_IRIPA|nr:leucine-rich repeat extensin-like protein 7 [Iris pallida]
MVVAGGSMVVEVVGCVEEVAMGPAVVAGQGVAGVKCRGGGGVAAMDGRNGMSWWWLLS